jgi:anti-anti-sigma regulatory factor
MLQAERDIWVFPASIDFEKTAIYTKRYRESKKQEILYFDLSGTTSIHTAFIGLLISIKHDLEKNGGRLILSASVEIERLFVKMKIADYLFSSSSVKLLRKTA